MKMTLEQLLAEEMVKSLLGEYFVLTEDRIDDLIAKFNDAKLRELATAYPEVPPEELAKSPEAKLLNRHTIESWMEFDPTRNKKYMPWIIKQVATGHLELPGQGELIRDDLMTFERLLTIPAYTGPRDLYQIANPVELNGLMRQHGDIKSKSSAEKEKKMAGVEVVAKEGRYALLKITSVDALTAWAWRAYSASNPNWKKKPILPTDVAPDDISDRKWCVRFPRYASSYLQAGPFYLVLKDGGPYVGIVFERGENQTLDNEGINTAIAEEIYPVVRSVLPTEGAASRNVRVFDNIKFLHGDIKDGASVTGPVDLANTRLETLPNNLTVHGSLDLTNCPIKQLPAKLQVEGTLKLSGTQISDLPTDLTVEDMEWSEPLTWAIMKAQFYRMRLPEMEGHYKQWLKDQAALPMEQRNDWNATTQTYEKPKTWAKIKKELPSHFQRDTEIDKNVKTLYRYKPPQKAKVEPTE
jgi:hypothetical protein